MSTVIDLFSSVKKEVGDSQPLLADVLSPEALFKIAENKNGSIIFNISAEVRVTLNCKHTTKNRRGKIVWYGEDGHFNFGFIAIGRTNNIATDFYAEISHKGKHYFINSLSGSVTSIQGVDKVAIVEIERDYNEQDDHDDHSMASPHQTYNDGVGSSGIDEPVSVDNNIPAWEPFDPTKVKVEKSVLKILAVYSKKTREEIEKTCLGKPYVKGKTTGTEMIASLMEVAEDVTNIIFENSRINTGVEIILEEIADPDSVVITRKPLTVKSILEGAKFAIISNDQSHRVLAGRKLFEGLAKIKQDKNAHVVCFLLSEREVDGGFGVAVEVPDSLKDLLERSNALLGQFFISVLLDDKDTPIVSLNRATFTHELGHVLGGEHPFIQINDEKNKIKVVTSDKDYYWMKGHHLDNPEYSTLMGYRRRIPYFSNPDVMMLDDNNHAAGGKISGVIPADMARGLRVTTTALANRYKYARPDVHIDIGVEPMIEGHPVPGIIEQDILGDYTLKLTAIPFDGRASFSHWLVGDSIVERGKTSIIINSTSSRKVRACFSREEKMHALTFNVNLPVESFLIFYELLDDKKVLKVHESKIYSHSQDTTLKFPHGTDIELKIQPDVSKEINNHIFYYTLGNLPLLSEIPRFRVVGDNTIDTQHIKLDFHVERGDLGYLVYEQPVDKDPYYSLDYYKNAASIKWNVVLQGIELANSDKGNVYFSKNIFLPYIKKGHANNKMDVFIRLADEISSPTLNKIILDVDTTIGKIFLSKEETLAIKDVSYSTLPAIATMTVAHGTKMYAQVLLSDEAKKVGYKVKTWSNTGSTESKTSFTIDNDITIKVEFTK